jgi:hypothetical protein
MKWPAQYQPYLTSALALIFGESWRNGAQLFGSGACGSVSGYR